MLTAAQVDQFARDGFMAGPRVLSDDEAEFLQQEVERVIRDREKGGRQPVMCRDIGQPGAPVWQIVNIWEASDAFAKLLFSRTITQEVAQLTNAKELRVWHDQVQYKPVATGGVNYWHQDQPYWPVIAPPTQVTAWVALDDAAADNGCMSMVPGTHLVGNTIEFLQSLKTIEAMPREYQGRAIEVKLCPVKKGHVHYHHALTWHGSHANKSGRPRRAVAFHFMPESTRFVAKGMHVMKQFINVPDGAMIQGEHFPIVWPR
jgi:hypothetical protein